MAHVLVEIILSDFKINKIGRLNKMQKVLVTGADGFIGAALSAHLETQGCHVIRVARLNPSIGVISIGDIAKYKGWSSLLQGVDCIIHCAAKAHVLNDKKAAPLAAYQSANVTATKRLVKAAIKEKVRRFVFLSSIGVLGSKSNGRAPYSEDDEELPIESYAVSKFEAEKAIRALCYRTELEYVIIRPPLVYGPNAKGNFSMLARYVKKGLSLPSFAPDNRRSLIALTNLVNFVGLCSCRHKSPNAANQTFLIADDEVISTSGLMNLLAEAYGKKLRLPPIPYHLMWLLAKVLKKSEELERMFDSLEINSEKARSLLGWRSVVTMQQQLDLMAEHDSNI